MSEKQSAARFKLFTQFSLSVVGLAFFIYLSSTNSEKRYAQDDRPMYTVDRQHVYNPLALFIQLEVVEETPSLFYPTKKLWELFWNF